MPEGDRGASDIPMSGPESRVFRYLPKGDPNDRAKQYIGEEDAVSRAQRYLTDSGVRRLPSNVRPRVTGGAPSNPGTGAEPAAEDPAPAVNASPAERPLHVPGAEMRSGIRPMPKGGAPMSALHSMVASVLKEREAATAAVVATPSPAPVAAPEPAPVAPEPIAPPPEPEPVVVPVPVEEAELEDFRPVYSIPGSEPEIHREPEPVAEPEPEPVAEPEADPAAEAAPVEAQGDHLRHLRDLAHVLRNAAVSPDGLQPVVDRIQQAAGADAVVLSLTVPRREQVVAGSTLGGGPRYSVPVRTDGANVGELMICRLTEREPFTADDELFVDLAAEHLATCISRSAAGSALDQGDQTFVNTLTNELRAPLGTVAGLLADFVEGSAGPLSEQQHGYLSTAADHTARLLHIIRDLQTIARLRRPEAHELDHLAVGPLLHRAAESRRAAAEQRGIRISIHEPEEALIVKGIPEQLDRAFAALVDNAVKFSHDGGEVTVSAVLKDGTVRFTVLDEGIGMDASDTQGVFERFARARTALEANIPGVGLGLTIVKEIVDVHGGRAWCESSPGQGTRTHFTLPQAA